MVTPTAKTPALREVRHETSLQGIHTRHYTARLMNRGFDRSRHRTATAPIQASSADQATGHIGIGR
jgi:hypothetical protein